MQCVNYLTLRPEMGFEDGASYDGKMVTVH